METSIQANLMIIAAIGAQIILIVAAIFNGWTALRANRIAEDTKAETQAQTTKIDTVAKETAVVLGHVNSEKTSDAKTIEFQARENQILRDQLAEKDRVAGLLAQHALIVQAVVTPRPAVPIQSDQAAETSLQSIDTQTKAIESNTAKTDAAVSELKKESA